MKNVTNEFSFVLRPSTHGIGVFALHDIEKDTYLRLFGDDLSIDVSIVRNAVDIPDELMHYCIVLSDGKVRAPRDFGQLHIGWFLNHFKEPNAYHKNLFWYALRNIEAGEEILIDYNSLEESEEAKESYYKS